MRDDLLDAQAAIDWAVSDLPNLQQKIDRWIEDKPYRQVGELDPHTGQKIIRLRDVGLPPAIINAEAGVILHSIRSSYDMLAVALAERNGATNDKRTSFPIWRDRTAFDNPADDAAKKIKRLSASDQATIKSLNPYKGGNDHLAALHELDLTRKHRRLVSAQCATLAMIISTEASQNGVNFVPQWKGFKDGAIIATGPAHASENHITLCLELHFTEPRTVSHMPLVEELKNFASQARQIIGMFDTNEGP